jgi:hypothetical protein
MACRCCQSIELAFCRLVGVWASECNSARGKATKNSVTKDFVIGVDRLAHKPVLRHCVIGVPANGGGWWTFHHRWMVQVCVQLDYRCGGETWGCTRAALMNVMAKDLTQVYGSGTRRPLLSFSYTREVLEATRKSSNEDVRKKRWCIFALAAVCQQHVYGESSIPSITVVWDL